MSRLIDVFEYIKNSEAMNAQYRFGSVEHRMLTTYAEELLTAPTVNAVEVVRCKDCVHWGKHDDVDVPGETERIKGCEWAFWMIGDKGYCSYGERRKDEP